MIAAADRLGHAEFIRIYNECAAPLRRYVVRALGAANADDVVQETFLRALAAISFPADPAEARPYLFRIAGNLVVDYWRSARRVLLSSVETPSQNDDPGLRLDLIRLFGRLRVRERQLLWMALVEGWDHGRIATVLGLSEGSVKVMLHRAKTNLAQSLRRGGYDD